MISTDSLPASPAHPTGADRQMWPRFVMATLLLLILSLTVHLVDITWFGGTDASAALAQTTSSPVAQR